MNKDIISKISGFQVTSDKMRLIEEFFANNVQNYINFVSDFKIKVENSPNYSSSSQDTLNKATFNIVKTGHELEQSIVHKQTIIEIKELFRKLIYPYMSQSIIMKRALDKPRGYPGDYMMLEYIYDDKAVSSGLGMYFDLGFLRSRLTMAVRDRKDMMRVVLQNIIKKRDKLNILNLASGSIREIRELSPDLLNNISNLTCVDFDSEALEYSKSKLKGINASFLQKDLVDMVKKGDRSLIENSDLIYSIGLIDYFPDRMLLKLITLILSGMKSGSKCVLTIKDVDQYKPIQEDWLTDWKFVPRTEDDIVRLIKKANIQDIDISLSRDDSKVIIFFEITKK